VKIRARLCGKSQQNKSSSTNFDYKQVLVIRTDLKMSRGKIGVQAAHAAVSAAEEARRHHPSWWRKWFNEGQKKVAVKVASKEELLAIREKAVKLGLPCIAIRDRGLTEIKPGTLTALGIGPGPNADVDKVTSDLPLL
jgi:PTH2 family peptidyl-tRNA hydrolase